MSCLSLEKRKFIFKEFIRTDSLSEVEKRYKRHYRCSKAPDRKTILRIVRKFDLDGSVQMHPQPDFRPRKVRSDFLISAVDGTMETTPTKSIRAVASEYFISKSSAQRIIRVDLGLYPYKITLVQKMKPDDAERRLFSVTGFWKSSTLILNSLTISLCQMSQRFAWMVMSARKTIGYGD